MLGDRRFSAAVILGPTWGFVVCHFLHFLSVPGACYQMPYITFSFFHYRFPAIPVRTWYIYIYIIPKYRYITAVYWRTYTLWVYFPSAAFWTSFSSALPCSQVSALSYPRPKYDAFVFLWRRGFSIPAFRRFASNFANSRSRASGIRIYEYLWGWIQKQGWFWTSRLISRQPLRTGADLKDTWQERPHPERSNALIYTTGNYW